jgi:cell shape-determining protein MreC
MFKTQEEVQARSKLIKCEALETSKGIKLGDTVTHKGVDGEFPPTSGIVTKIEYWLDYDLSYYRIKIDTGNGYIESAEAQYQ